MSHSSHASHSSHTSHRTTILIAPNDDGLGTSAWAVRLVRELARQADGRVQEIRVVVATDRVRRFHEDKYEDLGVPVRLIHLPGIAHTMELPKKGGGVDVTGALDQVVLPYAESRAAYTRALNETAALDGVDLLIDLGVPPLVRAAHELCPSMSRHTATVLDHAWSLTLRRIAGDAAACEPDIAAALHAMAQDEALADEVFLFPEPVAPRIFNDYWRDLTGRPPQTVPGVLGGPLWALDFFGVAHNYWAEIEATGRCPDAAYASARNAVRRVLGIPPDKQAVFVSGGGSPVWDNVLEHLITESQTGNADYTVVVYAPGEATRRGVKMTARDGVEMGEQGGVVFLGRVEGETHHVLIPAFDAILTRGGGGTVNDALACRVPLILVEEPGMWQVDAIRQSCIEMGVADGATLAHLMEAPAECLEMRPGTLKHLTDQRHKLQEVPNHAESRLLQSLLGRGRGLVSDE